LWSLQKVQKRWRRFERFKIDDLQSMQNCQILLTGLPKTRPWQPQKNLQMGRTFLAYAFEMRGEISKLDLERKSQWTIQNGTSRNSKTDAKRSEGTLAKFVFKLHKIQIL
jgi:hypothetical protein